MYTPRIAPANLTSVTYQEILDEITRDDGGALATEAIATAIDEATMYLTRFDLIKMFGDSANDIAPVLVSPYLDRILANMAVWYLLNLANPNISYEDAKIRYEQGKKTLKDIQKGDADPQWPYNDPTGETAPPSDSVLSIQSPKRNNSY